MYKHTLITFASEPQPVIPASSTPTAATSAFKSTNPMPFLSASPSNEGYPITSSPNVTNPGPVQWPSAQGRPTLTGGIPSGRVSGTPAQIAKSADDASVISLEDTRPRRKNAPGDQSLRRSIQDLVSSVDPNVKIEPEVEDVSLE